MDIEKRRLVKSGNTSFTLALPIDWVRKHRLNRGSEILISESETGDLLLFPEQKQTEKNTFYTLKIDGKDLEMISLELFQAYLHDYQTIAIEGKELQSKTSHILNELRSYIGIDVIEQTVNHISVKNFYQLDKETAPSILMKKMDRVNRSLFDLLKTFFLKGLTKEDLLEVSRLKDQNQRLFHLIRKSSLKILENPSQIKQVQTSLLQLSKDKTIALHLKNISLVLYSIGKTFLILEHTKKDISKLQDFFMKIFMSYNSLLSAVHTKDYPSVMENVKEIQLRHAVFERFLHESDDLLILEASNNFVICNNLLEDIAREALE